MGREAFQQFGLPDHRGHPDEFAQLYYAKDQGLSPADARYVVSATFQNGKAEILVNLILVQGQWQILGFRVNSSVLEKGLTP